MAECNRNLWAPWRLEYVGSVAGSENPGGCFLCGYARQPERDAENHIIWRTDRSLTCFNSFPYSNGHLLIAPTAHVARLNELSEDLMLEIMRQARDAQRLLAETVAAQGFNIGMNFGKCAGAGLPGHLHVHVVPRWEGDTNFMAVCADVRVIPQSIEALYAKMKEAAPRLALPPVRG